MTTEILRALNLILSLSGILPALACFRQVHRERKFLAHRFYGLNTVLLIMLVLFALESILAAILGIAVIVGINSNLSFWQALFNTRNLLVNLCISGAGWYFWHINQNYKRDPDDKK